MTKFSTHLPSAGLDILKPIMLIITNNNLRNIYVFFWPKNGDGIFNMKNANATIFVTKFGKIFL